MGLGRNLLNNAKILAVGAAAAAGTSDVTGAAVDTAGYQGVVFFTRFGTAAANNTLKVQQDTVVGMGGAADLVGSLVGGGASDELIIVEVHKPREQFVRAVALRGTSTTCDGIYAILYGANEPQLANNSLSGTQKAELHVSPAEGTA
jgi:hypothetical protein